MLETEVFGQTVPLAEVFNSLITRLQYKWPKSCKYVGKQEIVTVKTHLETIKNES